MLMIGTPRHPRKKSPALASGFSLLEVLVTVLITSIGLLSLAALQARALQDSHSSFQRTVTVVQANDLVERLWAARCARPEDFPAKIYADWRNENLALSAGPSPLIREWDAGTTIGGSAPDFNVTISWKDPRARDEVAPSFTYWFRVHVNDC
jgi:type IV pilus assembly protein PilV